MISTLLLIVALQSNPDRIETLTRIDDRACTGDEAWCVGLVEGVQEGEPVVRPVLRHPDALPSGRTTKSEVEHFQPWTGLVRLADGGFLAGVQVETSSMYSGGGGQATELRLYRLDAGGDAGAAPVLAVPIRSELMIRACFSEEDMTQRAGACHDEIRVRRGADGDGRGGRDARLHLCDHGDRLSARGFAVGGFAVEKPPLKPADLVKTRDSENAVSRAASPSMRPRARIDRIANRPTVRTTPRPNRRSRRRCVSHRPARRRDTGPAGVRRG